MQTRVIVVIVIAAVLAWLLWPPCPLARSEPFYSTVAPPKNFPEVIGLPLRDAEAYMRSKYPVRVVSTPDEAYRLDMSAVYLVVDPSTDRVTDAL